MSVAAAYAVAHPPLAISEIGRGREKEITKTIDAYKRAASEIAAIAPDTIVITTPHAIMYADYFHISPSAKAQGSLAGFGAPDVVLSVNYDEGFVNAICENAAFLGISAGTLGEKDNALDHGCLVPLYFIQKQFKDFKLVRVTISDMDLFAHYEFGRLISNTADNLGRKTVFIASGDLSHKLTKDGPYGFALEGGAFDETVTNAFKTAEFDKLLNISDMFAEKAAECGLKGFVTMAGALHKKSVTPELLSYEGPFGVGYAIASFKVTGDDETRDFPEIFKKTSIDKLNDKKSHEDKYVTFARHTVENYIKHNKVPEIPDGLPPEMYAERAGVFVSIKKTNNLRGCVGTIMPVRQNIAEEIRSNAISSAVGDSRFLPITEDELLLLSYSVDVLKELEPATEDMLDVKRYGVVVRNNYKKGLLLPNLDGVDTVAQQIEIAKQKAGIGYGEDYILERFEVIRHK